jgi:hypothetical protein
MFMTHESLKLANTLQPILRNMLNEHGQMLQQHHTKGDEDFLISKTITAISTALKSGEQPTSEPVKVDEQVECHSGCTEHVCRAEDGTFVDIIAKVIADNSVKGWSGANYMADKILKEIEPLLRKAPKPESPATPNQGKVSVEERCSPYNRQKWAETIARYFAGYSFSKHESRQCLGLVDVLIANGVSFPTPPAQAEESRNQLNIKE